MFLSLYAGTFTHVETEIIKIDHMPKEVRSMAIFPYLTTKELFDIMRVNKKFMNSVIDAYAYLLEKSLQEKTFVDPFFDRGIDYYLGMKKKTNLKLWPFLTM